MGKAEGGGSGWVILSYSPRDKRLVNQWAADHTTTLAGGRPVLVLDMYEHAYHMDFGAAAARYVDIYMEAIRWDNASAIYEQYARESWEMRGLRSVAVALSALAGLLAGAHAASAQTCKVCTEQRAACTKNYAGPACKTEYQMCRKAYKK